MRKKSFLKKMNQLIAIALVMVLSIGNVLADKGWQRVTNTSSLAVGDSIIIAACDFDYAISTTQNTNNRGMAAITKTGDLASIVGSVQVFVLQSSSTPGTFAIYDNDHQGYLYAPGGGNYLRTQSTLPTNGAGDWLITCSADGSAKIISQSTDENTTQIYMRFNNNSSLFSCYKSTSSVKDTLAIYKYVDITPSAVSTPAFSLASGTYFTPQQISITCATPGATILYTTDGTNPATNGTVYSNAITLNTTTTLKAVAFLGTDTSAMAATLYTFPTMVSNIAAFKAANSYTNNTPYRISGDLTFVFQGTSGSQNYAYVKDATGGLLIFEYTNDALLPSTYVEGDVISGGLCGTYTNYNNQVELKPLVAPATATSNTGVVTPTIVTIADLKANYNDYDAQLIKLQNVTLPTGFTGAATTKIIQGTDTLDIYKRFTLDTTIAAGTTLDIVGFAAIYGTSIQIYPRNNADFGNSIAPTPQPMLTINAPVAGSTFSTLDTLHIDLNIQNFVLGTDGLLKIESSILPLVNMPNPSYFDATTWAAIQNEVLSPLPAGTFTATVSLVGLDHAPLSNPVSATTNFTVVAPTLSTPTITFSGSNPTGTTDEYYFNATVTITAEQGATIHYTTDGTTPTESSNVYSNPFTVNTTTTVKALATKANYANSAVATATVAIDTPTVAAPVITPVAGTYADSVTVSINCPTETVNIYYTLDGSEPTSTATLYTVPFTLNSNTTVKAKAFKANWHASATVSAAYTIAHEAALAVSATSLNFNSTTLTQSFDVTSAFLTAPIVLTCNNTHFTLSQSTIPANVTSATITVTYDAVEPATATITLSSDTLSAQVTLTATAKLPTPTILPADGTTDTLITVTMACAEAGATIQYTMGGTTDTYTTPIVLNTPGTYTFTASASKANWENSESVTATYTVVAPTPVYNDTIIYYTGFENEEGFTASSSYNNDNPLYSGPTDHQWVIIHGTPSTTSKISGLQSLQMRYYGSTAGSNNHFGHIGHATMDFDLNDVTKVTFAAKNTNNINVAVSYSIDGGNTFMGEDTIQLSSTAQNYTYNISESGEYAFVRLRFAVALPENPATSTCNLIIDSVVVYGIPGRVHDIVEKPVISPNSGMLTSATPITITCATSGASIYYTTDGTIPTESSTLYTAPFTLSSTATIKAKAFKANTQSSLIAIAEYTFPTEVANIAAFKADNTATNNEVYKITNNVTFVFRNGNYMFIEDASGALMIYDNNNTISTSYNEGDVISGGVCGSYTLYNGMVEMIPAANTATSTSTATVNAEVVTIADLLSNYSAHETQLVRINNVTFIDNTTFVNGTDTLSIYNRFNTVTTDPNGITADIIGFVARFNNSIQIYPRDNNDIIEHQQPVEQVETPVITVDPLTNSMFNVTITCGTAAANIFYTTDGSTPTVNSTAYTEAFIVGNGTTVKAIAVKDGMNDSEVASYFISGINNFSMDCNIYPNPTTDKCIISNVPSNINNIGVYDIYGKLLNTIEVNSNNVELNMSQYAMGTYFIRINTTNGVITKKVVKQ